MNLLINSEQIKKLLTNLYMFTGILTNIYDKHGNDIQLFGNHSDFCRMMNMDPEGHERCIKSDCRAVNSCDMSRKPYCYRCHAGLREVIIPLFDSGELIAFLAFGQLLDMRSYSEQWEHTLSTLDWYKGDIRALQEAFMRLKRLPQEEFSAYIEILEVLAAYIQLEQIIHSAEITDKQRLEKYIDEHYMEKQTLKKISAELGIGTTKLCALAKSLPGGSSITTLISLRRVEAAKSLLAKRSITVTEVAGHVGFSDYNYFTKTFKKYVGVTPSEYRRIHSDSGILWQHRNEQE